MSNFASYFTYRGQATACHKSPSIVSVPDGTTQPNGNYRNPVWSVNAPTAREGGVQRVSAELPFPLPHMMPKNVLYGTSNNFQLQR